VTALTRVYAVHGKLAHLLRPGDVPASGEAFCRRLPAWFGWRGTGSQLEYEVAASLPLCSRCEYLSAESPDLPAAAAITVAGTEPAEPVPPSGRAGSAPSGIYPRGPGALAGLSSPPPTPEDSPALSPAGEGRIGGASPAAGTVARFTVNGEPAAKERPRVTARGTYTPDRTQAAEQVIGWMFRQAAPRHQPGPATEYGVTALFLCGTRRRRDVDNMLKLVLDGLNGIAWLDDAQVTEVSARKVTCAAEARTEVTVYELAGEAA